MKNKLNIKTEEIFRVFGIINILEDQYMQSHNVSGYV